MDKTNSQVEFWLKRIALIISTLSGIIAFIPQLSGIFGPFDYAAEIFLLIFAAGIIFYGITLLRIGVTEKSKLNHLRSLGLILIIITPVLVFILWVTFLKIPPEVEKEIKLELARGETDLELDRLHQALKHFKNAQLLAPRRGSIRARIQDIEERIKNQPGE